MRVLILLAWGSMPALFMLGIILIVLMMTQRRVERFSWLGLLLVCFCVVVPLPAAIIAAWLTPEGEGMFSLFLILGAFPVGWTFTGIGCWALGRIWNQNHPILTFLGRPVEYCGLILFLIGLALSLFGWWEMYLNGMFA